MEIKVESLENKTYKVNVTYTAEELKPYFEEAVTHEGQNIEIPGFRKGNAPASMIREKLDPSKLRGHVLNHLLPDLFDRILKEYKYIPVVHPKVDIREFEEGKGLDCTIIIIEKPDIVLGDYQTKLKEALKDKKPEEAKNEDVVEVLLTTIPIGISSYLIDEERDRMLSQLIDQVARMGVTVEQYLQSHNKTVDDIREEYAELAMYTLQADFIVSEIAKQRNVQITDKEIDNIINATPDQKSKDALMQPEQRIYIKAILLKSKTLTMLREEAVSRLVTQ